MDDVTSVFWQERVEEGGNWSRYYINSWTREGNQPGLSKTRVLGPFRLTGEDTPIFSFVLGPNRSIWLAVQTEPQRVDIYRSGDLGVTFLRLHSVEGQGNLTNPRITLQPDNRPLVVMTRVQENLYQILVFSQTTQGGWTLPTTVTKNPQRTLNFNPYVGVVGKSVDLVYQSLVSTRDAIGYQVFLTTSPDSGVTWGPEVSVTGFPEGDRDAVFFQNDRPSILSQDNEILMAWERTPRGQSKRIYFARFSRDGSIRGEPEVLSPPEVTAEAAHLAIVENNIYCIWFDNRKGVRTLNASRLQNGIWAPLNLRLPQGSTIFGTVLPFRDGFSVAGQQDLGNQDSIFVVNPDKRVEVPQISPQNFQAGRNYQTGDFRVRVQFPSDPAGVSGFNYIWTQNRNEEVERTLARPVTQPEISARLSQEGPWFLKVIVRDGIGNWSAPQTLNLNVDNTPPGTIAFIEPETDEEGFLLSNVFSLAWEKQDPAIVSYTFRLEFLGTLGRVFDPQSVTLTPPPRQSLTLDSAASWNNLDNGFYALTVAGIDEAGNIGSDQSLIFRLNKYIAYTRIDRVEGVQDDFGKVSLRILGRGFLAGGTILHVWIDQDTREPYAKELSAPQFQILSDREIALTGLEDLPEGFYRVGIQHSLRGRYWSGTSISVDEKGNVKLGDFSNLLWDWSAIPIGRWLTSVAALPMLALLALLGLLVFSLTAQTVSLAREQLKIRLWYDEIKGRGILMIAEPKPSKEKLRGLGLQVKFIISILGLTVAVILMLSVTLGFFITENSQRNLGTGLHQRTEVLLDSLATGARNVLPDEFIRDLTLIPGQRLAMSDSMFVTITGRQLGGGQGTQFVWASDDPDLGEKITGDFEPGRSLVKDEVSEELAKMEETINAEAVRTLNGLNNRLQELTQQSQSLVLRTDAEAERIRSELGDQIERVNGKINNGLRELGRASGSFPPFDPSQLSESVPTYLFYKPVLYIVSGESTYVQGFVRLKVSVDSILADIRYARNQLIQLTGLIALAALGLGLLGSFLLATITVRPIRSLVRAVARIRDTEDKEKLKDFVVDIRTGDELALLADTINEMTEGLVKAAAASKDLTLGKEIQKMFIPLQTDNTGRKMTSGHLETKKVEFFGYYEGAKGVSGDYFDYQMLDEDHFAIIKCDVAGKGVPAALIMVEVATVFLNYFKDWKPGGKPLPLSPLVGRINMLVEERGFKGRFAALTIGLYDVRSGIMNLCNAGDTVSNYYSSAQGKMVIQSLPKAPAAGVFSTDLVDMQGGFKEVKITLAKGDTIFFYTDGVEEAKRVFRNKEFQPITIPAPNGEGTIGDDELGALRVHHVVEAVFRRGKYSLIMEHSPFGDKIFEWDFSSCQGTVREAILAMVSVEQIWRLIPDPAIAGHEKVKIDLEIYGFLKQHFLQFSEILISAAVPDELPEYIWLSGLREDAQYDDLTILGMRRLE